MTAIILAGGFGTRLKSVISNLPKPMAPINKKPFLEYLFDYLLSYGVKKVILCVGYKHEIIIKHFQKKYKNLELVYSIENKPLGTGGAIKQALKIHNNIPDKNILILNGDTFYQLNIAKFYQHSLLNELTIAIKPMKNFTRYGSVEINGSKITSFKEKESIQEGLINTGVYIINPKLIIKMKKNKFSFESFLEAQTAIDYYIEDSYFVDIGIPEDYRQAQIDFKEFF
ncbi:nucleotidyltransferase family protein [Sulfurimonas sp. SAG-AH-194-C21]|nr:nucleotidyltransferase family protein [Sulfurimonas sp. SAG-AH-194-C21]MDF1883737.1 nucleotidyltransferase family protein [Sulfurimonas sp. SAG-AH-194-C21]